MPSRKKKLARQIRGLKMRSKNNLMRLRDNRLKRMGIDGYHMLVMMTVLLALIGIVGWLRQPVVTRASFRPVEESYLRPLVGWAIPAEAIGSAELLDVSLVYADVTWAELEPEKGVFAFVEFEKKNHLDQWWADGKRLILRFVMDRPGKKEHMDIPEWLVEEMGGEALAGAWYETEIGSGFAPDYSNLMLREAHRKVIAALAERYNNHPGVAYIELGSLGWNGEWTVDPELSSEKLPISTVTREYAWHYTSAFSDTLMLMRRPYKEAQLMEVGLYNTLLGDFEATWEYLETMESGGYDRQIETDLIAMPDFYRYSPSGAHISAEVDLEQLLTEYPLELSRQIVESHLDYVVLEGDLSSLSERAIEQLEDLRVLIGYRLWMRSARWDSRMKSGMRSKVVLGIRNDGAAPLHDGWPLALALFDDEEMICVQTTELDSSMILPGDNELQAWIDIPYDAKVGVYELKLAILDPQDGEPGVRFSNAECDPETLWITLGELRVIG